MRTRIVKLAIATVCLLRMVVLLRARPDGRRAEARFVLLYSGISVCLSPLGEQMLCISIWGCYRPFVSPPLMALPKALGWKHSQKQLA